jgi:hypothetical protein
MQARTSEPLLFNHYDVFSQLCGLNGGTLTAWT